MTMLTVKVLPIVPPFETPGAEQPAIFNTELVSEPIDLPQSAYAPDKRDFIIQEARNDAESALQQAQIEMLVNENPRFRKPFYWAGFIPIGGFAEY